jgi:hypothetical protein
MFDGFWVVSYTKERCRRSEPALNFKGWFILSNEDNASCLRGHIVRMKTKYRALSSIFKKLIIKPKI